MSAPHHANSRAFQDTVIWITGASSGIGEALARAFAAGGAGLVLSSRQETALQRVRDDCAAAGADGDKLLVLPLDVTDYAAMPGAVQAVLGKFGRIDMLINNAGTSQRSWCLETDMAVYRTLFELNVLGQIALTKAVLPVMVEQGSGHLLVTASVAGKVGVPLRTGYCAAKHAVMGFFDALRTEVAHLGIRVTTITPGFIRTNIGVNALTGTGAPTGKPDIDIDAGMDVSQCAEVIVQGIADGLDEIVVGVGQEMMLLELKRQDPTATFRALEGMAVELRQRGQSPAA
ncbi:MAG: SDR family oxidoreductase [Halioglobus sp.]|nr:SDR family oxidoreductase [Halioglobus sp.]MCB1709405.1 SDR family oxidoreductase [Halioglobus sp.]MCP5121897.1 SDR family oxidoreductase [Pseudomonadales bacterium]MCP5192564.1 SDR family oxidoreductase [Pseudomonadales bacterium]